MGTVGVLRKCLPGHNSQRRVRSDERRTLHTQEQSAASSLSCPPREEKPGMQMATLLDEYSGGLTRGYVTHYQLSTHSTKRGQWDGN